MEKSLSYDLKKAHEMLEQASKLIDGSNKLVPKDLVEFDRRNYVLKAGYALNYLFEMQDYILNLEPELTPEFLRPSLRPHDMSLNLMHLKSEEEMFQRNSIKAFYSHFQSLPAY